MPWSQSLKGETVSTLKPSGYFPKPRLSDQEGVGGDGAGGCMGTPDSRWFTCLGEENSVETVRRNLPVFLFRFL